MGDELLDVVDENDMVNGQALRSAVHASQLWHRGIHIFLFDNGRMIVQRRGPSKDKSAGLLDCAVSGHVPAGSAYDETAKRELVEELGITCPLEKLVTFRMVYGETDYMFSRLYVGRVKLSELNPNPDEIGELLVFSKEQLCAVLDETPHLLTRWFREMLKWYFGQASDLIMPDGIAAGRQIFK